MLENSHPEIALSAPGGPGLQGQDDQMLSLIAFGPADEYMKRAGIRGEPEEEEMEMKNQEETYLKKYGQDKIDIAIHKPVKEAAEILGVAPQTIGNIRSAFRNNGEKTRGPGAEDTPEIKEPKTKVEPVEKVEMAPEININPVINLHIPSEIVIKAKFVR